MSSGDFPQMIHSAYASTALDLSTMQRTALGHVPSLYSKDSNIARWNKENELEGKYILTGRAEEIKEKDMADKRRIVQVFICDPNDNIPLDKALLSQGEQKLTDATDQELFYEISIKELLDKHNALRAKTLDKSATKKAGKDVFLEPIRIRDLKMIVTTVAEFG